MLRALLDDIAAAGGLKGKAHREALDLVDAFVRGEAPTPEALATARAGVANVVGRIGVGSSPLLQALSCVPIELLLRMVEQGDDLSTHMSEHAAHVIARYAPGEAAKRVAVLCEESARLAAGLDDAPFAAPPGEIRVGGLDVDLPAIAIAYLRSRRAERSGKHAGEDATRALLAKNGYQAHAAALAFEAAYGGLELFESDPDAPALAVGPYALLSAWSKHSGKRGDPVPVLFASNDVHYALDAKGRGFTQAAMVEGVYRPSAPSGRAILTQAILWRALETHPRSFVRREGLHGVAMAKERGITAITDAMGKTERWWGDASGKQLVVEIDWGNGCEGPMTYATSAP